MNTATGTAWSEVTDGTAVGPVLSVRVDRGEVATVSALWSDHEGVVIDLELPEAMTAGAFALVVEAAQRLYALPTPE